MSLYNSILSKTKSEDDDREPDNEEDEEGDKMQKRKKKIEKVEVQEEEIFTAKSEHGVVKGLLTKDILYIYDGRSVYGYELKGSKMEMFGLL